MAKNWKQALDTYRYPVDLGCYRNSQRYEGYFNFNPIDNLQSTKLFEDYFRSGAKEHIELWLEVIYWKMYSQAGRRENVTDNVGEHFIAEKINPAELFKACVNYINEDSSKNLKSIIKLLGFTSNAIAIAATFPAFILPEKYPMVDTRIAKWVGMNMTDFNHKNINAPQLVRPNYPNNKTTVLTLSDMDFVKSWTQWCQYKAHQLSCLTEIKWRARDVEMAVFNAWGNKNENHPKINLEII